MPSAVELLELLREVPESSLVGFEVGRRKRRLHLGEFPSDDRSAAAGLFCMQVPRGWNAVGFKVLGTARNLDDNEPVARVVTSAVVTRNGEMASCLQSDADRVQRPGISEELSKEPLDGSPMSESPQGTLIDSLHRMLGLPSPGPEAPQPALVMGLWCDDLIVHILDRGTMTWIEATSLHPLAGANPAIAPSVEMIVEATLRASHVNWERLRMKAVMRGEVCAGLAPEEIAWMDATMYSRWVLGTFPEHNLAAELLVEAGCHQTAERLRNVANEVARRCASPPDEALENRSA